MAKNPPYGDHYRVGAVRERSQTYNAQTERWVRCGCTCPSHCANRWEI